MSRPDPAAEKRIPANAENRYQVGRADLPLSCPMPVKSDTASKKPHSGKNRGGAVGSSA